MPYLNPDDPERSTHVLGRNKVDSTEEPFDEDVYETNQLLSELRKLALADEPWIGTPSAMMVLVAMAIGVGLISWNVSGVWFTLVFLFLKEREICSVQEVFD